MKEKPMDWPIFIYKEEKEAYERKIVDKVLKDLMRGKEE